MIRKRNNRGQSLVELGILFAIVVGALMAMKVYVQRGMQSRIKTATDYKATIGEVSFGGSGQYEPQYQTANVTTIANASEGRTATAGAEVTMCATDNSNRTGNVEVAAWTEAYGPGNEDGNTD